MTNVAAAQKIEIFISELLEGGGADNPRRR
jgi:hypothetical protein